MTTTAPPLTESALAVLVTAATAHARTLDASPSRSAIGVALVAAAAELESPVYAPLVEAAQAVHDASAWTHWLVPLGFDEAIDAYPDDDEQVVGRLVDEGIVTGLVRIVDYTITGGYDSALEVRFSLPGPLTPAQVDALDNCYAEEVVRP